MADPITRLNEALEGRYHIERELGEGGMATVYLAEDRRHERKVALKVLKPELSAVVGAERFLAEIKTTANLQHPHILPLHDSGEADGLLFYVMPYVDGESLRQRLDREKQLPLDEAVGIAVAVAGALDYAHQHGVVHRDIKPANILMQAGQPVVGDFGIALAVGAAGGARITETGLSVGTPFYMSPEQATGDVALGPTSDIYALGCVLYEMLTGEPPYTGSTAQAVLGRIIQGLPVSATAIRSSVPPNLDAAIRKALEKLPADRFASAHDFASAMADPSFRHGESREAVSSGETARWRRTAWLTAAVSVLLGLALGWSLLRPGPAPPVARYGLEFAPGQEPLDLLAPTLALAPDGSAIVYVGPGGDSGQLWLKPRDRFQATPLLGTEGALAPSVSPDGSTVVFQVDDRLGRIPLVGGASVVVADSLNTTAISPASWFDDGSLVYVDSAFRLRRLSPEGGIADAIWTPPEARYPFMPRVLPGSRGLVFTLCNSYCTEFYEIWGLDLETGEARSLVPGAVMAEYAPTGHLIYVRPDGSVFAQAFDPRALEVEGAAEPVLTGVKVDATVVPDLVLSPSGTLVMRSGSGVVRPAFGVAASSGFEFAWVARGGAATPVHPGWTIDPGDVNRGWSLSPDGTMLAARIETEAGPDIWVKGLPQGPLSRLTFYEGEDRKPRWSPDGSSLTFLSDRGGDLDVWTVRSDGVGEPTLLYDHDVGLAEGFWAPGGDWLVLRTGGPATGLGGRDILAIRPGADSLPTPFMTADYDESAPALSPDSRWIAYRSNETGRDEVFVRPFPDVRGGKWQVSTDGGTAPLWAHDGQELFYVSADRELMAVQVESDGGFRVGERRALFLLGEEFVLPTLASGFYDVTPDDERFLFLRVAGGGRNGVSRTILVENWFEELRATLGR